METKVQSDVLNLLNKVSAIRENKMELKKQNLLYLLNNVSAINKNYDKIAEITGENFNIFQILKVGRREVMHSGFLAELLNPFGNHGQGITFLRLFFNKILKLTFENGKSENIKVRTEVPGEEGRVDIIIEFVNNVGFIIENKIDAGDGYKQLLRYHHDYPKYILIYLNLDGHPPSDQSIKDEKIELKEGINFIRLSYSRDIVKWLELCQKEASNYPLLRETISQYINLIKLLTNQTTNNKMEKEIVDSIIQSPENIKAAFEIAGGIEKIREGIILKLFESLNVGIDKDHWELKLGNESPLYNGLGFCYRPLNKKYQIYFRLSIGYSQIDLILYFDESQDETTTNKFNFQGKWLDETTYYRNSYIANDGLINIEDMKGKINEDVKKIVETLKEIPGL